MEKLTLLSTKITGLLSLISLLTFLVGPSFAPEKSCSLLPYEGMPVVCYLATYGLLSLVILLPILAALIWLNIYFIPDPLLKKKIRNIIAILAFLLFILFILFV